MHGFAGLHRNFLTWLVLLIIVGTQWVSCFTFLGRPIFEARLEDGREFYITVVCGASVLLANALFKAIPARWIAKMPTLDEDKAVGSDSKMMSMYQKGASAKAFNKKPAQQAVEVEDDDEYQQVNSSH